MNEQPSYTAPVGSFPIDSQDLIAGLGRGLRLIEAFDDTLPRMTIAQAAARTAMPRSAVRRHLLTLCHLGYMQTDGKLYWLAPRVLRLGRSYLSASRMHRQVQPFIQRLSETIGETVNVSVLDGHEVAYIARSSSPRLVSIGFQPGDRAPAHVVAPGVALVSALSDEAAAQWMKEHDFVTFTARTVTTIDDFAQEVAGVRQDGFCKLEQQLNSGLTGVAVLLTDLRGRCHAAMGTSFPTVAWTREDITSRLLPALRATVENLRPLL